MYGYAADPAVTVAPRGQLYGKSDDRYILLKRTKYPGGILLLADTPFVCLDMGRCGEAVLHP